MDGNILYVDDQVTMTKPLRDFIAGETGRRVVNARNTEQAIDILKEDSENVALVLLDIAFAPGAAHADPDDPLGLRAGLTAAPILKNFLKAEAEIWFVSVRANEITDEELAKAGIPREKVYAKPIRDLEGFLKDIKKHLAKL